MALLKAEDFAPLDAHFSAVQRAYREGALTDEDLRAAFRVFYDTDASLAAKYDAWLAKYSRSYVAHLARGIYFKFVGNERRGGEFVSKTSEAQLRGMREAHSEAAKSLYASFALDEKPILSYLHAIDLSSHASDERESRRLLNLSLRADPRNFIVREKYIGTLQSRWGGSLEQMIAFYDESKKAGLSTAHLQIFEGLIAEERGWIAQYHDHDYAAAARAYREAEKLGREHCVVCFAKDLIGEQQYDVAIAVLDGVLKDRPDDAQALAVRSDAYKGAGKRQEWIADLEAGTALGDAYSQLSLGVAYMTGVPGVLAPDPEAGKELFRKVAGGANAEYASYARVNLERAKRHERRSDARAPGGEARTTPPDK
jgi:tetratricopeptide (TPR) repeat protein